MKYMTLYIILSCILGLHFLNSPHEALVCKYYLRFLRDIESRFDERSSIEELQKVEENVLIVTLVLEEINLRIDMILKMAGILIVHPAKVD